MLIKFHKPLPFDAAEKGDNSFQLKFRKEKGQKVQAVGPALETVSAQGKTLSLAQVYITERGEIFLNSRDFQAEEVTPSGDRLPGAFEKEKEKK